MNSKYISSNYQKIRDEIGVNTKLLAVTKNQSIEAIEELINLGQKDFGENKVQELSQKADYFKKRDIKWHFIGHLQSNKIKQLLQIPNLSSIHSIGSIKLLNKLLLINTDKKIEIYLQVNTSLEEEKSGMVDHSQVEQCIELLLGQSTYIFKGIMTLGRIRSENFDQDADICFKKLADLKNRIENKYNIECHLSMGMSGDYKIAQKYKTNIIRIGTKLFL